MRWMVLVLLVFFAAPAHAFYHGDDGDGKDAGSGDVGDDTGDGEPGTGGADGDGAVGEPGTGGAEGDAPADPPGWESAPETVGAQRDQGDGEVDSRGMILLVGSVLVIAVLAAAMFFASRRP